MSGGLFGPSPGANGKSRRATARRLFGGVPTPGDRRAARALCSVPH